VNHTVVAIKSDDENFENCLECLIWQFSHADIIVGAHGRFNHVVDVVNNVASRSGSNEYDIYATWKCCSRSSGSLGWKNASCLR